MEGRNLNDAVLLIALLIGAILMCLLTSVQMKWYGVKCWKSIIISVTIIFTGLIASELWFFLENGYWAGRSFYGAIFFAPLTFFPVARLLRIKYLDALDFCATAGCLVLAVLKVQCMIEGCCAGIILYLNEDHMYVRFPSQVVEFVCALVLTASMLTVSYHEKFRGRIYPLTLVLYGTSRFALNLFRDDWVRTEQMNLPLPLGNIWSLVAVFVGVVWLCIYKGRAKMRGKTGR